MYETKSSLKISSFIFVKSIIVEFRIENRRKTFFGKTKKSFQIEVRNKYENLNKRFDFFARIFSDQFDICLRSVFAEKSRKM